MTTSFLHCSAQVPRFNLQFFLANGAPVITCDYFNSPDMAKLNYFGCFKLRA